MSGSASGGAAFPHHVHERFAGEVDDTRVYGMTLRDYFAGQALVGIIAHPTNSDAEDGSFFARMAYRMADAMLAERAK